MPIPEPSDEQLQLVVQAYQQYGVKQQAAEAIGMAASTFKDHLRRAAQRGLLGADSVLPGFTIHKTSEWQDEDGTVTRRVVGQRPERQPPEPFPEGFRVKRISQYTDADGNQAGGWKIAEAGKPDPAEIARLFREALDDYRPEIPSLQKPTNTDAETLATYFIADWHLGVAATNWGLKEAEQHLLATASRVVSAQNPARRALIVVGGDFLDIDNWDALTPKSKHSLNPAGTLKDVLFLANHVANSLVALALQKHEQVEVIIVPGNHDEVTALAVASFLRGRYHNEPRLQVLDDDHGYFCHQFGSVGLFIHHGHKIRIKEYSGKMAGLYPKIWGETTHRHAHGFHLHHREKLIDEHNGVISEIHQSPAPKNEWGRQQAFISGQSIQSILYHVEEGEWFRVTRPIREWSKAA